LDNYPYVRIFNPWTQSREHDPDATYIKKWVPELDNIEVNDIHNWRDKWREHKGIYIQPIVVFEEQRDKAVNIYSRYY
jgi:deoxyribodipyrimidine photo-lyase